VIWDTHDGGIKGDDDYNLWLYTPPVGSSEYSEGGMINQDVRRRIRLEFDSDETIDEFTTCGLHPGDNCKPRFQFSWWNRFRHLVDDDGAAAHREIHGHLATVVGLMGVDYVHDANSGNELHPVHVFAVHLDRSSSDPTHFTDHWAIFVRNWGNEGECGALDHYLLANDLTLRLAPTIDPSFRQYIVGQSTTVPRASIAANFADAGPVGFLPAADPTHPDLLLNFSLHEPGAHSCSPSLKGRARCGSDRWDVMA